MCYSIRFKKKLEYNESDNIIEGFQNLADLGREANLTNTAMVFMIRGMCSNWKITFSYCFGEANYRKAIKRNNTESGKSSLNINLSSFAIILRTGSK